MTHPRNLNGIGLDYILEKKRYDEHIILQDYLNALVNESKRFNNYGNAEEVFNLFLNHLNDVLTRRRDYSHTNKEAKAFQKMIITMTRYAPGPQKALDYTSYLLSQDPPLRTELSETKCLNNLILKYGQAGSLDDMNKGLELVELALQRNIPAMQQDNVGVAFVSMSRDVLAYHEMKLSADMKTLEPQ